MLTGRNPILLGVWVDLKDVGPSAEDGLLSMEMTRRGKENKKRESWNNQ